MSDQQVLPRDHPSYNLIRSAARSNFAKWGKFLQPEDRPTPEEIAAARAAEPTSGARPLPVVTDRPPCAHLGNRLEVCHTCGGEKDVYECDLHGKATRTHVSHRVRSCDRCPDYSNADQVESDST